jgi:hypothetical protein
MRSLPSRVAVLLLSTALTTSVAAAPQPQRLEVISAGAFADLPMQGALADAVKNLVEGYGVAVAFGTDKSPILRPELALTRGDLVQWLSATSDWVMQSVADSPLEVVKQMPLSRAPLCAGSGWRAVPDIKAVADFDAAAPWASALENLLNRYDVAIVAERGFAADTPVTVAEAQACLASFDPAIKIAGKKKAAITRGAFIIGLSQALDVHAQVAAALVEAADIKEQAERRARRMQ